MKLKKYIFRLFSCYKIFIHKKKKCKDKILIIAMINLLFIMTVYKRQNIECFCMVVDVFIFFIYTKNGETKNYKVSALFYSSSFPKKETILLQYTYIL